MGNIKDLIGARLTDVENNVDGFTVLYFTADSGGIFAIDLAPTIRNLSVKGLKETAPEVPVQEQLNKLIVKIGHKVVFIRDIKELNVMDKYKKALTEVLINLRSIGCKDDEEVDSYVDDSIKIISEILKEG